MRSSWITISRPRFWLYLAGPYLIGQGTTIDAVSLYGLLFFLIPANVLLYAVNDYADTDTDQFNEKKLDKESWAKSSLDTTYRIRLIILSTLMALPLMYFSPMSGRLLLAVFIFLSYAYSLKPFRLKGRPFLDSMSNVLYIIPGIYSYTYVTGTLPDAIYIVAAALWSWSMHLFSAIPDIKPDSQAGIQTTAVLLGTRNSLILCAFLWGMAGLLMHNHLIILLCATIYALVPILLTLRRASNDEIMQAYWKFPYLNACVGFALYLYINLL